MHIEFTNDPRNEDINFIISRLNEEVPKEYGQVSHFAFFIRNDTNEIIAGCSCFTLFGIVYVDHLWVAPQSRRASLGSTLMKQVHEYGRKNSLSMSVVHTMSFSDAKSFYEKLGYKVYYERKGHASNSSCISLSMKL